MSLVSHTAIQDVEQTKTTGDKLITEMHSFVNNEKLVFTATRSDHSMLCSGFVATLSAHNNGL